MILNSFPDNGRNHHCVTSTPDFHVPSQVFNPGYWGGGSITYGSFFWELFPPAFRFHHTLDFLNRDKRRNTDDRDNYPIVTASSSATFWSWCIEGSSFRLISQGLGKGKDTTFSIGFKVVNKWWIYGSTSVLGMNWAMLEDVEKNRSLMISRDCIMGRYVFRRDFNETFRFISPRIALTGSVFIEPLSKFGAAMSTGIRLLSGRINTVDIGIALTSCPSHIQVHLLASKKSSGASFLNGVPIGGGLFYDSFSKSLSARLSITLYGITFALIPRTNGGNHSFGFRVDIIL
eukprot:Tbor_TRINITY_DN5449_c1_g14::TRINITY_DN5449_c1_g14_i1::g.24234::m.24234